MQNAVTNKALSEAVVETGFAYSNENAKREWIETKTKEFHVKRTMYYAKQAIKKSAMMHSSVRD